MKTKSSLKLIVAYSLLVSSFFFSCNQEVPISEEPEEIDETIDISTADVEKINCETFVYHYEKEPEPLNEITNIKTERKSNNEFLISWDPVENASSYDITYAFKNSTISKTVTTTNNYYTLNGNFYRWMNFWIKITAKSNDPIKYTDFTTDEISIRLLQNYANIPEHPRSVSSPFFVSKTGNSINIYFNSNDSYFITYYRKKGNTQYKQIKTSECDVTIDNLNGSTIYEIYIEGYNSNNELESKVLKNEEIQTGYSPDLPDDQDDDEDIEPTTTSSGNSKGNSSSTSTSGHSYNYYMRKYRLNMDKYEQTMKKAYERAKEGDKTGMRTYINIARGYLNFAKKYLELAKNATC